MKKINLGKKPSLYPMPTVLVGTVINGKPNYITIAHVGIMDLGSLSLGMAKAHYTNQGIKANKTFSINIPSMALIQETDYCGLVSGKQTDDKNKQFTTFYGAIDTAPLIEECVINMECQLIQTVDFPNHDVFIGEVTATHVNEDCLMDQEVVDFAKVNPILFAMSDRSYWTLGDRAAKAWDVGKTLLKKTKAK